MLDESDIRAPVLLNLLNLLQKRDKMLDISRILSLFLTCLINSIKHEHKCKILYMSNHLSFSYQFAKNSNVEKLP